MDLRSLARPVAQLLTTARRTPLTPKRGHKTTARTKRALKIAPHDSFLPDRTAASPAADSIIYNPPASEASPAHTPFLFLPPSDPRSIIYNPPASEASPAHTPFLFLPPSDPRRSAFLRIRNHPRAPVPNAQPLAEADLPPKMRYKHRNPRYNLQEEDVAEMRRLRAEDPIKWSVGKLAQRFDCSEVFVKMAAPAPQEHLEWLKGKLERKAARWGPRKTQAREDRKRRADLVYRGQL
ncbi:60S ribosomal protein L20 [Metarhizium acridum CQMa 102]|uniref:60S ribosomal protein L20 n=1 Tax=Metarhizium acridum (strain CQMa 102) TaxID=655827 RepID=E9EF76_METAQ|nr:60S ribosomal protein L20 [Metarhizium acridum CQMa 102]EFY85459.1 60S ribosomal protein L20 [Metarhizium acridum CQMa 102]